jgi:ABC-type phosphate transport system substrate-binding protein
LTRRTLAVLAAIGAALVLTTGAGAKSSAGSLTGAGSSFVAPLVSAWIPKVDAAFGVKVT